MRGTQPASERHQRSHASSAGQARRSRPWPRSPTTPQEAPGQTGQTGQTGPAAGKVRLVTCTTVTRRVKGKLRKVKRCKTKLLSGTATFTTTGVRARVSRAGGIYATGSTIPTADGSIRLVLTTRRALAPGRYTLTLRLRSHGRWITDHSHITIT